MSGSDKKEKEIMFRFQLISMVRQREMTGESRVSIIKDIASTPHHDLTNGRLRKTSVRSLYRWLKAFEKNNLAGLAPKAVAPKKRVLDDRFLEFMKKQKEEDPACSVPELIRRAEDAQIVSPQEKLSRTTVWRRIKESGLPHARLASREYNSRRFACENRMQMVLCDGKHFRAGVGRSKRVVLIFIDDSTRFVIHGVVGESESARLFQRGLFETVKKYGMMQSIYMDHGSGFTARDSVMAVQALGINLILSTAGYPQGRGKIERFNRTLQNATLRYFPGNPEVDPGCISLEIQINHYLSSIYNHQPHEGLNGKTPSERFFATDQPPLRLPESEDKLREAFVIRHQRRVSRDNVVAFNSRHFEMPPGYSRQRVRLLHKLLSDELCFHHRGKEIVLMEVDKVFNAHDKRARQDLYKKDATGDGIQLKTHARLRFEKDCAPLVNHDGGYVSKENRVEKCGGKKSGKGENNE